MTESDVFIQMQEMEIRLLIRYIHTITVTGSRHLALAQTEGPSRRACVMNHHQIRYSLVAYLSQIIVRLLFREAY